MEDIVIKGLRDALKRLWVYIFEVVDDVTNPMARGEMKPLGFEVKIRLREDFADTWHKLKGETFNGQNKSKWPNLSKTIMETCDAVLVSDGDRRKKGVFTFNRVFRERYEQWKGKIHPRGGHNA